MLPYNESNLLGCVLSLRLSYFELNAASLRFSATLDWLDKGILPICNRHKTIIL